MKSIFVFLFALLISIPAIAQDKTFHAPQTEAEKALDKILKMDSHDTDLTSFIWKYPERNLSLDKKYDIFFTKEIQDAWAKYYLSIPEEPEGGRYVGFDFIMCGNGDAPEEFVYATVKSKSDLSYIAVSEPKDNRYKPSDIPSPFVMKREKNIWKLDGVSCFKNPQTNFHYTN